ncbi:MAG: hypothetical protein EHM19_12250, partial [Candidatus Latescibacterota bacterium]
MPNKRTRKRPLAFADLMAVDRIGQAAVSPDGMRAVFVASRHDPKKNEVRQTIRLVDLASGEIRDLTPGPGNHRDPAWSPDGRFLAFASDRDKEEGTQLWVMPSGGGEARRVTSGYGGAEGPLWAPDSRRIAFARKVVVSADYAPGSDKPDPKAGPPRAKVYGLVSAAESASKMKGTASLTVTLTDMQVGGSIVSIKTQPLSVKGGSGSGTKKFVGGALVGTAIGAIAGG